MAALRCLRRTLANPFALVLLLLTLGTAYLLLQWALLNNSKGMNAFTKGLHQPVLQFTEDFLKRYDYDYLKCKRLAAEVTSLEDLKRVTSSYLVTLADLEEREHIKLDELEELQASVQNMKDTVSRLTAKSARLKHQLLRQVLKASELEARLLADQKRLDDLVEQKLSGGPVAIRQLEASQEAAEPQSKACSIDTCFSYKQCTSSRDAKLRVHVPGQSEAFFERYGFQSAQVKRSLEFVSGPSDACLVVVYFDIHDKHLPGHLNQLHADQPHVNFMLVLPSPHSDNATSSSPLAPLRHEWPALHRKLSQSLTCSLERPTALAASHGDLWLPFSLLSDTGYLASVRSLSATAALVDYLHDRDHLISFHAPSSSQFLGRAIVAVLAATRQFDIDLECIATDCGGVAERLARLRRAQFTLIVQPVSGETVWSAESTRRLVEALSVGTLPVLVGMSARPPLEGLVAWSDILVQLPLARLPQLGRILAELDRAQVVARQVRASNVYRSYFASNTAMFRTLFAAVQHRLNLEIAPLDAYSDAKAITFSGANKNSKRAGGSYKQTTKSNNDRMEYQGDGDETYFDAGQENDEQDIEYLGEINQKPAASASFHNNFTRDSYASWNRYYHPFNAFPATPFDSPPALQDSLFKIADQFSVSLNATDDQDGAGEASEEWRVRFSDYLELTNASLGGSDGKFFNHMLGGNQPDEQFTIVILTYKREQLLMEALEGYLKAPYLHSVLVVWNAVDVEPSSEFQQRFHLYVASERLRLVRSRLNSLSNRFLPYDAIQTDAVLSLDDDVLLRPDEIQFAFRVWRENRDRLVGFPARHHTWHLRQRDFLYQSYLSCEYSLVLTGAAFYHRFYNFYYSVVMSERIRARVDELNNCEDIAFNMMVAHLTRKPPLKVTSKWSFGRSAGSSDESASISLLPKHYENRSRCIRFFVTVYGYNPLLYSQFRADSVLFKTQVPEDTQKCYKLI